MNIKDELSILQVSHLLKEISMPARIKILLALGKGENCVCHLVAKLGMRQAYLSQHLMALRQADVLITNRDGRFINYRLSNPKILDLVTLAADSLNIKLSDENASKNMKNPCSCPKCHHVQEIVIPIL